MDFLNDLNDMQRVAVQHVEGPSLIVAGAGSGKTRVLTYRIAYMLRQGIAPYNILALTFTNKAAKEMRERIARLIGEEEAGRLWMGTFHSMFSRILRREADALNYPPAFTIYDAQDSKNLIKQIVREMELDSKCYTPKSVASRISSAKNNLITVGAYAANSEIRRQDTLNKRPRLFEVYEKYAVRCSKSAVMDFDDLLLNTNILFRDFPDRLEKYRQRFQYILVDEYQDTNYAQYLIIKRLSEMHHNVCVVGDDSQSIYAFRGAQIQNILNFRNDYPDYRLFKLEQNYRSTKTIVQAANSLIAKNVNRIPKEVWSANDQGEPIKVLHAANDYEEGFMVVRSMQDLVYSHHFSYAGMAILYRTHAQSRIFEEALRRSNIPYMVYGGLSFYQRKEVKDVLAYLRLIVNPRDDEAFRRVINYPARGIGDTTLMHIATEADRKDLSLWEVASDLPKFLPELNRGIQGRVAAFIGIIQELVELSAHSDAYQVASVAVQKSGIVAELQAENVPENVSRIENIEELLNGVQTFVSDNANEEHQVTLPDYIENVSLLTDLDQEPTSNDCVTMMTVHSAKGLEYDAVYVVGMEENLFPSEMTLLDASQLEEERRLFYVAMTRARERLFVSYADTRMRNGETVRNPLSRFVREIDPAYLDMPASSRRTFGSQPYGVTGRTFGSPGPAGDTVRHVSHTAFGSPSTSPSAHRPGPSFPASSALDFVPDPAEQITVGMRVLHKTFGEGEVLEIEGTLPNIKATVRFDHAGMKQLLLKFARLKIVHP